MMMTVNRIIWSLKNETIGWLAIALEILIVVIVITNQ